MQALPLRVEMPVRQRLPPALEEGLETSGEAPVMVELVNDDDGPARQTLRKARNEAVGILADAGDGLGMVESLVCTAGHNDARVARQGRSSDTVHDTRVPCARAGEKIR